jgi:hypothetical protein
MKLLQAIHPKNDIGEDLVTVGQQHNFISRSAVAWNLI